MKVENTGGSVVQLEEGIYLIPGRKSGGCNVFVLRGTNKVALIDTGMPGDHDFLCASLAAIGLSINDVGIVIATHEHIDHVGGLQHLPSHIMVAAHARAATKLALDDQFSMMSGLFGEGKISGHVDIHLEDGTLIDLGGIRLRTLYTPGHCSGAICLYEPNRGALFTADTLFAGGILGGIFASGNVSDYIDSLKRLKEFRLVSMYPGHGRMSSTPEEDLDRGIRGSVLLMSDTRSLFDAINVKGAFGRIKRGTVDYSRRAAERREETRVMSDLTGLIHLDDADHPVFLQNVSLTGARLDRQIEVAKGARIALTIDAIGDFNCEVIAHSHGHTRLKFLKDSPGNQNLTDWLHVACKPAARSH